MQRIDCVLFSYFVLICGVNASTCGLTCDGPNEKSDCVVACPPERTCKNRDIKFSCLNDKKCQIKCVCKEGFIRNDNGICISENECVECAEPNEELYKCKNTCPPELCISIVARFKCDGNETCQSGCFCKAGYFRIKENTPCVPICMCPEMRNSPDCEQTSNY